MAGRLSRFRLLERARAPKAEAKGSPPRGDSGRFEALQPEAAAPSDLRSAEGHLVRFQQHTADELVLDRRSGADPPFVHCARCETENGRFAVTCGVCGADFDTPEQRAFNERLWATRRAEEAKQTREYYEELARQVGRETRERLGADSSDRLAWWRGRGPLGGRRWVNLAVAAVVMAILLSSATATGGTRALSRVLVMIALVGGVIGVRWWLRRGR